MAKNKRAAEAAHAQRVPSAADEALRDTVRLNGRPYARNAALNVKFAIGYAGGVMIIEPPYHGDMDYAFVTMKDRDINGSFLIHRDQVAFLMAALKMAFDVGDIDCAVQEERAEMRGKYEQEQKVAAAVRAAERSRFTDMMDDARM